MKAMKMMAKGLVVMGLLMAGQSVMASPVCFGDLSGFNKVRAQLPMVMKSTDLVLVHSSKSLIAGLRIFPEGQKLKMESHLWHSWLGIQQDESLIKKVCVEKTKALVTLEDGSEETINLKGQQIEIKGYPFQPTNMAGFMSVVSQIAKKAQ